MLINSILNGSRTTPKLNNAMFNHGKAPLSLVKNHLNFSSQMLPKDSQFLIIVSMLIEIVKFNPKYSFESPNTIENNSIFASKIQAISGICAKYLITEKVHIGSGKVNTSGEQHVC